MCAQLTRDLFAIAKLLLHIRKGGTLHFHFLREYSRVGLGTRWYWLRVDLGTGWRWVRVDLGTSWLGTSWFGYELTEKPLFLIIIYVDTESS